MGRCELKVMKDNGLKHNIIIQVMNDNVMLQNGEKYHFQTSFSVAARLLF